MAKRLINNKKNKSDIEHDFDEAEIEWLVEARGEGYTWKQLAKRYNVSIPTLKKFIKNS